MRAEKSADRQTDRQTAFRLYISTSKCTCPIVQEQMISCYNDIDLYMLKMVKSGGNNSSNTEALALDVS